MQARGGSMPGARIAAWLMVAVHGFKMLFF